MGRKKKVIPFTVDDVIKLIPTHRVKITIDFKGDIRTFEYDAQFRKYTLGYSFHTFRNGQFAYHPIQYYSVEENNFVIAVWTKRTKKYFTLWLDAPMGEKHMVYGNYGYEVSYYVKKGLNFHVEALGYKTGIMPLHPQYETKISVDAIPFEDSVIEKLIAQKMEEHQSELTLSLE